MVKPGVMNSTEFQALLRKFMDTFQRSDFFTSCPSCLHYDQRKAELLPTMVEPQQRIVTVAYCKHHKDYIPPDFVANGCTKWDDGEIPF